MTLITLLSPTSEAFSTRWLDALAADDDCRQTHIKCCN